MLVDTATMTSDCHCKHGWKEKEKGKCGKDQMEKVSMAISYQWSRADWESWIQSMTMKVSEGGDHARKRDGKCKLDSRRQRPARCGTSMIEPVGRAAVGKWRYWLYTNRCLKIRHRREFLDMYSWTWLIAKGSSNLRQGKLATVTATGELDSAVVLHQEGRLILNHKSDMFVGEERECQGWYVFCKLHTWVGCNAWAIDAQAPGLGKGEEVAGCCRGATLSSHSWRVDEDAMKAAHGASETQMDAEAAEKQGGSDEQNG